MPDTERERSPQNALQQRAIGVIKPLIPIDAKERVRRAVERQNRMIRNHIREATGLTLGESGRRETVTIHVEDGFTIEVATLVDKYRDPALWRLISILPELDRAAEGLSAIAEHWSELEQWSELPVDRDSDILLQEANFVVGELQELAVKTKVLEELHLIQEDILGLYQFSTRGSRINIYWMAQALFSAAFAVTIEDLTAVTVAHELAHAYTHLGRDIDGVSWHTSGFAQSDKAVVEGLAQHFTAEVMDRLKTHIPNGRAAYQALLEHQSGPYRAHESWFHRLLPRRGEIVRFTMLQARNFGKITDDKWRQMLEETEERLGST